MTDKEKRMASYDEETPKSFLKEVMYECEGLVKGEQLTIRKNAAVRAFDMIQLQDNGFDASEWKRLAWNLNKNRVG